MKNKSIKARTVQNYSSPHWTRGGTGITNFSPDELKQYQSAIAKHGDRHIIISNYPMSDNRCAGLMSLHDLKFRRDLSSFWATFDSLKTPKKP